MGLPRPSQQAHVLHAFRYSRTGAQPQRGNSGPPLLPTPKPRPISLMSSSPKWPAHRPGPETNTSAEGGFPNTSGSGPPFLVNRFNIVKRGDEKDSIPDEERGRDRLTIDALSDDDLLHIFYMYGGGLNYFDYIWSWGTLLHVCQRWRHIIFTWPHHLDVRVVCKSRTAVAKALDVWPALPICLWSILNTDEDKDGVIAGLEHRDRIAAINLSGLTGPQLQRCATLMEGPFPILRSLSLCCNAEVPPVITDAFLAGSAPRLQRVKLSHIPFPTLPRLLSSAHALVELHLEFITASTGYISPEAMATCLAVLTRLRSIDIIFRSRRSLPQHKTNRCPPPLTRAVLPSLSRFLFEGVSEYLEDLITWIDAPLLNSLSLKLFYQPIFDIPQLPQFIHRVEKFKLPFEGCVDFYPQAIDFSLVSSIGDRLLLQFQCTGLDRQLSLLEQVCNQCLPLLSLVHELELSNAYPWESKEQQDFALWLGFLRPFNAVQVLAAYDDEVKINIARALGELTGERATEVLPMLRTLELNGFDGLKPLVIQLLKPFIDARQLSDHPVVVC